MKNLTIDQKCRICTLIRENLIGENFIQIKFDTEGELYAEQSIPQDVTHSSDTLFYFYQVSGRLKKIEKWAVNSEYSGRMTEAYKNHHYSEIIRVFSLDLIC